MKMAKGKKQKGPLGLQKIEISQKGPKGILIKNTEDKRSSWSLKLPPKYL